MTPEAANSGPILVYGQRKAGTTLAQCLLDGSPDFLMVPGELKLKFLYKYKKLPPREFAERYFRRGRSFFRRLHENNATFTFGGLSLEETRASFDVDSYLDHIARLRSADLMPAQLIDEDARAFLACVRNRPMSGRWAAKEVGGNAKQVIGFFFECFPNGQVVFALRDSRFVVRSIILYRQRRGVQLSPRQLLRECREARQVARNCGTIDRTSHRTMMANYEQMTVDTAATMTQICQFLSVRLPAQPESPTCLGLPIMVTTSSKCTKAVFQQEKSWIAGLGLVERTLIRLSLPSSSG